MADKTIRDYPVWKEIGLTTKSQYSPGKSCETCGYCIKTQEDYTRSFYKCTYKKSSYRTRLYFVCDNFKPKSKKR